MNIYILEDNWVQQVNLEKIIHHIEESQHLPKININTFSDNNELKKNLPSPSADNVFLLDLEINKDRQAGLELSQFIRANDIYASIIFITVHEELLPITYKYKAEVLDFIAKDGGQLKQQLTNDLMLVAKKAQHFPTPTLMLKTAGGYLRCSLNEIIYFEPNTSNTHQPLLHTFNNQVNTINLTLSQLDKMSPLLFRAHRHCLINLKQVKKIDTYNHRVYLAGIQQPQPLSRLKNQALLKKLAELGHNH